MGSRFEQRSDMINIFEKVAMPGVLRINCGKAKKKSRSPWEIIIVNTDKPLSHHQKLSSIDPHGKIQWAIFCSDNYLISYI